MPVRFGFSPPYCPATPRLQSAYMAMAEIYGREKRSSAYQELVASIHEVFPMPDITLQRVREAYELVAPAGKHLG